MGKIKRFVTKPRDCDAFATMPRSAVRSHSSDAFRQGDSWMKTIANRALQFCAALAASMLPVSARASAAAPSARFDWFEYRGSDPVDSTLHPGPNDYRN